MISAFHRLRLIWLLLAGLLCATTVSFAAIRGYNAAESKFIAAKTGTETVQRAMSRAELESIQNLGALSRGGRPGPHFVSDAVNSSATRARQRLALPGTPEVRVTLEVPQGTFSPPSTVQPYRIPGTNQVLPGGGLERTAPGNIDIPARVIDVLDYTR